MFKKLLIIATLLPTLFCAAAQSERFSINELVEQLLKSNHTLIKSGLETDLARNNISLSGFLPTAGVTLRQSQQSGSSSTTNTLGGSAQVGWRLFDGLGMFAQYDKQKQAFNLAELYHLESIQTLVSQLMAQYYMIISLENRLKVAEESMQLSQMRYNESRLKYDIGAASGLEKELAKTDYNTDSSNLVRQRETLDIAYATLNGMLTFSTDKRGYIRDTITLLEPFDKQKFEEMIKRQNVQILAARLGADMSDIDLRFARAARYPTLDFAAGYNYGASDANNPRGNFAWAPGYNWGFTIGVNLFNGLEVNRKIRQAKINQSIADVTIQEVENKLNTEFSRQWISYESNLKQIDFETENAAAMRFNLVTAMSRYRLGDLSGIDLRIIQQQYLDAVDRKINVIYQAKTSEITLLTLASAIM